MVNPFTNGAYPRLLPLTYFVIAIYARLPNFIHPKKIKIYEENSDCCLL